MNFIIEHSITTKWDRVQLVQFYPNAKMILQNNYISESFANTMIDRFTIGKWRIKRVKPTDK